MFYTGQLISVSLGKIETFTNEFFKGHFLGGA